MSPDHLVKGLHQGPKLITPLFPAKGVLDYPSYDSLSDLPGYGDTDGSDKGEKNGGEPKRHKSTVDGGGRYKQGGRWPINEERR